MKNNIALAIIVDGGIVQGVVTSDNKMVGKKVAIVDYDIEGSDPDNTIEVTCEYTADRVDANVNIHAIKKAKNLDLNKLLDDYDQEGINEVIDYLV